MKISEMIFLLDAELKRRGDVKVILHGAYGAESETFEVAEDKNLLPEDRPYLNIWTDICTG